VRRVIAAAVVGVVLVFAGFLAVGAWRSDSNTVNPNKTTVPWIIELRPVGDDDEGESACGRPPYKDCPGS
jgi:hypothetical protein